MKRRLGRTSETSEREKRAMKGEIIKDRRLTNSEVAAPFVKASYAVKKTLKGFGYERKVAKKKPFISKMNKRKVIKET